LRATAITDILPADMAPMGRKARGRIMTSVINLNRFRKAKRQDEAQRRAAENRAAFGRSKSERRKAEGERERDERALDGKRIE
jgi:Domain of unknown function (DUF4169)